MFCTFDVLLDVRLQYHTVYLYVVSCLSLQHRDSVDGQSDAKKQSKMAAPSRWWRHQLPAARPPCWFLNCWRRLLQHYSYRQLFVALCCPPPTSALWNDRRCMSVRPSVRRVIWSNSRTQRTRKPKIAAMEANQTSNPWTYLEVKRSMVKVTRPSSIGNNNDSSIRSSNSYTGATIALPTGSDVEGASRRTSVHTNPYEENTVRNIFRRKWKAFYGSY